MNDDSPAQGAYADLEARILDRDQIGASTVVYDLLAAGSSVTEILSETVRVHAPYTHMPYHQRIDGGMFRFVNNDHCLLSASATLRLRRFIPEAYRALPLAQTVWYVPTGLDPWNQLLGKMPGHYARRGPRSAQGDEKFPAPECHWPDEEPLYLELEFQEGLNEWLTLVQQGEVQRAYRVFLGLFDEVEHRDELLAQLVFAGLIDVQDRMLWNTSYTTGHKAFRARATVELGRAIGWDRARHVIYAGVPDLAVGPHWHSAYEMACQVAMYELEDEPPASRKEPTRQSRRDAELFANAAPLTAPETESLIEAITKAPEPAYIEQITRLLKAGRAPQRILDAIQIAAARVILETAQPDNFSMPQHGYEYTNTLRWFYETFEHPHRVKLLYVAGSFIHQCAHWARNMPGHGRAIVTVPDGADALSRDAILHRLEAAMVALDREQSVAWTRAYLEAGYERRPLIEALAFGAAKHGNDPHNQEIGLCLLEDYQHVKSEDADTLLLACANHTAGHRKYGDSLEAYRRLASALGLEAERASAGEGDPIEALRDDIEIVPVEESERATSS